MTTIVVNIVTVVVFMSIFSSIAIIAFVIRIPIIVVVFFYRCILITDKMF